MSEHTAFLDRTAKRLDELGARLDDLRRGGHASEPRLVDAGAALDTAGERLKTLRRRGNELTLEETQSFRMSVERVAAQVGELGHRAA